MSATRAKRATNGSVVDSGQRLHFPQGFSADGDSFLNFCEIVLHDVKL